jgi:hypothetical protein
VYDGVDIQWPGSNESPYHSYLLCGGLESNSDLYPVIVNSGPYDFRQKFNGFMEDEEYIIKMTFDYVQKTDEKYYSRVSYPTNGNDASVKVRMANYDIDSTINGYDKSYSGGDANTDSNHVLFYGRAKQDTEDSSYGSFSEGSGEYTFTQAFKCLKSIKKEDFLNDRYQLFIQFLTAEKDKYILIKELQFYKKYPKKEDDTSYYTLEDDIEIDTLSYQEETKYFEVVQNDTRAEKDITFLPATTAVIPLFSADGSKRACVDIKESNYFNGIQLIAETFECWPEIQVNHDESGHIVPRTEVIDGKSVTWSKRIYFKNYIGEPNHAGFRYGINNKDIKRTLDSKQIVSKLIVKSNSNEYGQNGFCTI